MKQQRLYTKKNKAKEIVTDMKEYKTKTEKLKELKNIGLDVEELKQLTLDKFNENFEKFQQVSNAIDTNRKKLLKQLVPIFSEWSFEEIFVYCIDILNSELITIAEKHTEEDIELKDFFPVLYDEIYTKCVHALTQKYSKNNKNIDITKGV